MKGREQLDSPAKSKEPTGGSWCNAASAFAFQHHESKVKLRPQSRAFSSYAEYLLQRELDALSTCVSSPAKRGSATADEYLGCETWHTSPTKCKSFLRAMGLD